MRGCAVSRIHIDFCNCDVFSVDHLNFRVVCIYSRRCVCCSECKVDTNECDEPTP